MNMIKNILLTVFIVISAVLSIYLVKQNKPAMKEPEQVSENMQKNNEEDSKEVDLGIGKTLDLSNQGLDKLPQYVLSRTSIEKLDISNNNITGALPAEIRQLQKLKVFDASNNKMTGVPAEVGQLSNLEILDLSNNQLTGLPYELGNLKNLKVLNLSGNNYAQQDLEKIKEGLPDSTEIIL